MTHDYVIEALQVVKLPWKSRHGLRLGPVLDLRQMPCQKSATGTGILNNPA